MDFVTIDFETATAQRDSPCEIGLTFVENFEIVESRSWLIKPFYEEFDSYNIFIHGISPKDVKDKPEFDELWTEIKPLIENRFLIAHNAAFDFSVLRKTLERYNLSFPIIDYSCSYLISKKIWKGLPSYDLKSLCNIYNIDFIHHRAEADSLATAKLITHMFKENLIFTKGDITDILHLNLGRLFTNGYQPSGSILKRKIFDLNNISNDPNEHDQQSIFYRKTIVFTGTLSSMNRSEAQKLIAKIGGSNRSSITKETDFLIVGQQDFRIVGEQGMSMKQKKALDYIEKGSKMEIISEDDFIRLIDR